MKPTAPILVTGAGGYVGGRLIPALVHAGYRVRGMGRSVEKLACRPWARDPRVELVKGDVVESCTGMPCFLPISSCFGEC
jgi:uncharacterized protein YbjT (DUF2867 family)